MNHTPDYPLSRTQKEIMEFELQYPGSSINNLSAYCELPHGIGEDELRLVLDALLKQEQALRMQLARQNGTARQDEHQEVRQYECARPLTLHTATLVPGEDLMAACERQGQEPFPLWDSPLYRLTLLQTETGKVLLYTLHHVIADGWSMAQLAARVQAGCERVLRGESPDETPHCCTRFIEKEWRQQQSGRFDADGDYWREQFAGFAARSRVKPGPEPEDSEDGRRISYAFTPEEVAALHRHCDTNGVSPAIPVLTAIVLYLKQQNPTFSRIDIGEMVLNRSGAAETETIGNFAAELLLCVPVASRDTMNLLEQNVGKAALSAYHHGSFLHDDVLGVVRERMPETAFLRDVEFGYLPPVFADGRRLNAAWVENCAPETAVEINLFGMCQKDELSLIVDYRTAVLTPEEAEDMLGTLREYLHSVVDDGTLQVDALLSAE